MKANIQHWMVHWSPCFVCTWIIRSSKLICWQHLPSLATINTFLGNTISFVVSRILDLFQLALYQTIRGFNGPEKNYLKAFWEKEERLLTNILSFFHNVFSILTRTWFWNIVLSIYIMLSFELRQKLCCWTLHTIETQLNASTLDSFWKHCRKRKIACDEQFLLFLQCFLLNQIIVSPFVHIFYIISLFTAELEDPKIGIWGKGLKQRPLLGDDIKGVSS